MFCFVLCSIFFCSFDPRLTNNIYIYISQYRRMENDFLSLISLYRRRKHGITSGIPAFYMEELAYFDRPRSLLSWRCLQKIIPDTKRSEDIGLPKCRVFLNPEKSITAASIPTPFCFCWQHSGGLRPPELAKEVMKQNQTTAFWSPPW